MAALSASSVPPPPVVRKGDAAALARALEAARPVSLASEQVLPVVSALADLFPWGGLSRGSVVAVRGEAARSLAFVLLAEAVQAGSWVAMVGVPSLGLQAAAFYGVALERTVVVEAAGPDWLSAIGAAIDGFDLVLTTTVGRRRGADDLRRFQQRARERGCVLVVLDEPTGAAEHAPGQKAGPGAIAGDVSFDASLVRWFGLTAEAGHLSARQVAVVAGGRRGAHRMQRRRLWLPDHDGQIRRADDGEVMRFGRGSLMNDAS